MPYNLQEFSVFNNISNSDLNFIWINFLNGLSWQDDEFVIYNPYQQRLRYVVQYKLPDDPDSANIFSKIEEEVTTDDTLTTDVEKIGTRIMFHVALVFDYSFFLSETLQYIP